MAKSRYADATKAARRAAMSAHKATAAASDAVAGAQPTASAATEPARDARRDELTHVDAKGEVRMVDVSDKAETHRIAIAEGTILMHPETQAMVLQGRVKKGDVLYRLDDVQYQAALQSAKAAVMQAQAEALYAERDYKRQQALYEQKASSRDVLDAAERTAKTSAAALASAKAALIPAEDNLKHCVIAAPMDGRMSFTNYSAGNYVTAAGSATTTLATLVSVSPVRVRAALSMKDIAGLFGNIAELQKSAAVQAELSDGSDLSEIGRITAVDNAADEKTDTLYAAAEFKDPLGRLVPGSTVTITITLSKPDSLFPAVQPSALQHDAEGAYVWVVNAPQDGAAQTQKRRVEVGRAVNGRQLITAGLQKDDVVVVEGMQKAGEGKTVKVQQAAAPSAGAAAEQPAN